jgi:hypothetical protein
LAPTRYLLVDSNDASAYPTISAALADAPNGAYIRVRTAGDESPIVVEKRVSLVGEEPPVPDLIQPWPQSPYGPQGPRGAERYPNPPRRWRSIPHLPPMSILADGVVVRSLAIGDWRVEPPLLASLTVRARDVVLDGLSVGASEPYWHAVAFDAGSSGILRRSSLRGGNRAVVAVGGDETSPFSRALSENGQGLLQLEDNDIETLWEGVVVHTRSAFAMRRNYVHGGGIHGVLVVRSGDDIPPLLEYNTVSGFAEIGMRILGGVVLRGNVVTRCPRLGISITGTSTSSQVLEENQVFENGGGIVVRPDVVLRGNTVRDNKYFDIRVIDDPLASVSAESLPTQSGG